MMTNLTWWFNFNIYLSTITMVCRCNKLLGNSLLLPYCNKEALYILRNLTLLMYCASLLCYSSSEMFLLITCVSKYNWVHAELCKDVSQNTGGFLNWLYSKKYLFQFCINIFILLEKWKLQTCSIVFT